MLLLLNRSMVNIYKIYQKNDKTLSLKNTVKFWWYLLPAFLVSAVRGMKMLSFIYVLLVGLIALRTTVGAIIINFCIIAFLGEIEAYYLRLRKFNFRKIIIAKDTDEAALKFFEHNA